MSVRNAERGPAWAARKGNALSPRQRAALFLFAALTLGFAAIVAAELRVVPDAGSPLGAVAEAPPSDTAAVETFSLPPLDGLSAVTERPLFARNRRPLPPPAPPIAAGDTSSFVLTGVTRSGTKASALVRHGMPPSITRLSEGRSIDGWTVRTIAADRIVLRHGAEERTLFLYKEDNGAAKR